MDLPCFALFLPGRVGQWQGRNEAGRACTKRDAGGKVWGGSGVDRVLVRYISDTLPIHLRYTSDTSLGFCPACPVVGRELVERFAFWFLPCYAWPMSRLLTLLLLAAAVAGCRSLRLGPYTSPRVTGRVLAADTHQPLAGVQVTRDSSERMRGVGEPPKGAELLLQQQAIETDGGGQFVFPSERALTVFRPAGWDSVLLAFQRAGYERFRTNYSITTAGTNSPTGEPLLEAGDILLRRAQR